MSCTEKCWTPVECPEHGGIMWPAGRSAPLGTPECCELSGRRSVNPRHLFGEHDSDRYYFDREGWDAHYATCPECNSTLDAEEIDRLARRLSELRKRLLSEEAP